MTIDNDGQNDKTSKFTVDYSEQPYFENKSFEIIIKAFKKNKDEKVEEIERFAKLTFSKRIVLEKKVDYPIVRNILVD